MTEVLRSVELKQAQRDKIKADTDAFIASGRKIKHIPHYVMNDSVIPLTGRKKQWSIIPKS